MAAKATNVSAELARARGPAAGGRPGGRARGSAVAQRLVQRVERARPRNRPASIISFTGSTRPQHRAQEEQRGRELEAAPRRCWSSRCGSGRGTRRRASRSTEASSAARSVASTVPGQQVEDGSQRDAGQRRHQPPGPGLVAEDPDPGRDEQLRGGRMHPFRRGSRPAGTGARSSRGRPRRRSPPAGSPGGAGGRPRATSASSRAIVAVAARARTQAAASGPVSRAFGSRDGGSSSRA